jgi:hypothetical protein
MRGVELTMIAACGFGDFSIELLVSVVVLLGYIV